MRDFKLIFDRTFSKSIAKKLLWLVGFILLSIFILYFLGYIPSFYQYGKVFALEGRFVCGNAQHAGIGVEIAGHQP